MRRSGSLHAALALLAVVWVASGNPTFADADTSSANPVPAPGASPTPVPSEPSGNPFPSPSPSQALAGSNGYVALGYARGSASGGMIQPVPASTSTPASFPGSTGSGFWVDILGRLAPSYLASLSYENYSIAGGDRPLLSFAQLHALYQPRASPLTFGIGLLSAQRSTANFNLNAVGLGVNLLPGLRSGVSPYGSIFIYPHVQTGGSSSALTAADLGIIVAPPRRGGLFFRLGGSLRTGIPAVTSPTSLTALEIGGGTSF